MPAPWEKYGTAASSAPATTGPARPWDRYNTATPESQVVPGYTGGALADLVRGGPTPPTAADKAASDVAAGMSVGERLLAGYGRGVAEVGQSIKQLTMHADAALAPEADDSGFTKALKRGTAGMLGLPGMTPETAVKQYDEQIRDEARQYDAGLGQTTSGGIGRFLGGAATTAPLGGVGGAAGRGLIASGLRSAAQGAAGSALATPVTGEGDFAAEKAKQAGLGAAVGAGVNTALRGVGRIVEDVGFGNAIPRGLNALNQRANKSEFADEGERLAQQHSIELTPGQISGSKAQNAAENLSRQAIFTRDAVFANDMKIADQYVNAITRTMDKVSKEGADSVTAGNSIRASVDKATKMLQSQRAKSAADDFAKVDQLAKGAPVIMPKSYRGTLENLIKENSIAPKGSDARALADALGELHGNVMENAVAGNLIKTRRYLSQVAGGQAALSGSAGAPMQKRAARQLLDAIDQDIDATSEQVGGDIGEALRTANQRYRDYSQKIDGIQKGPLGKLIGEDLVDSVGDGFSSIPSETVFARFSKLTPSQMKVATKLLGDTDNESLQGVKRAYIQQALDKAQSTLATGGAEQASIRPAQFLNSLGKSPEDKARLDALFSPSERKEIEDLFAIGRRVGDRTGYNSSETAFANQTMGLLGKLRSGIVGGGAEIAGMALGTRQIARMMADSQGRRAIMELRRLPPSSSKARELTAYISTLLAADPSEPENAKQASQ